MSVTFSTLKDNYPVVPKAALYDLLGGEWPTLVNDQNYANTCAIRLSVALTRFGINISRQFKEAITGQGESLILKVSTMGKFLTSVLGDAHWGMSKRLGHELVLSNVLPGRGILVYHAHWSNATGHFDLWDGSQFVGNGDLDDVNDGYSLAFWKLE